MTETDQHSQMRGVAHGEGSPGRPPGRPMRQLEFHQAMSDFRHMFPETDEEVIEAVLRANNGMVDATIDQLLTMNIDTEVGADDDDLPDHILMSVERDVQQQQQQLQQPHQGRRLSREARAARKATAETSEQQQSKDTEDCPPSYTEAVQSHLPHHHRSSHSRNRHRNSPTNNGSAGGHHPRHSIGTMQHLLDLGPDSAPGASGGGGGLGTAGSAAKSHHGHHHHHNNHHHLRSSNHHRHRGSDTMEGSPGKSRPGRNILASATLPSQTHHDPVNEEFSFRPQRKEFDASDFGMESGVGFSREKSPHQWRSSHRESTNVKRPVYKNWNPPLLGTLPDDFLRISKTPSVPTRPSRHGSQLQRTMSAVGPERPHMHLTSLPAANFAPVESNPPLPTSQHAKPKLASQKPHRSLSFAGHTGQLRRQQTVHSSGLAQHEFSTDILQERMKENERRRRMASASMDMDPDLAQYLEDERLAIMLQNSEFLQELRGDRMFMLALERDQSSNDGERSRQEPQTDVITPSGIGNDDRDFIEGYGDDRRETLEAFPFSQQLPPPASEDMELRQKLKNMGKASKKQFAALARKFFLKRRKKSAQQILKESQAPSMMNLLDEDDDEDVDDAGFFSGERSTGSEPYGSSNNTQNTMTASSAWSSPQTRRHFDVV